MSVSTSATEKRNDWESGLVLIAEDEEPLADTIAYVVREAGYRPLVALHGRQALELARSRRPALIIMDLMLPHLSGEAVIRTLRESESVAVPPIILITGANHVKARAAGADAVLLKPFNLVDLERLLHRFLKPPAFPADAKSRLPGD
jgi:DNA-binding response OmpR family regulator